MPATDPGFIDVRELLARYTLEQLNRTADEYFHQFGTPEAAGRLLAKPFICPMESPELLISFANVMQGLQLSPGLTVLDFGAGSCWSSRFLTQLGYRVIACDVSPTALDLGRRGFELFPVQGPHHPPRFLVFDGRKLELPDASIDRIVCMSAFHHVPNQEEVLCEMARVLRPGGIAGFSEPGPNHSRSAQSQHEMRHFTVIENDIRLEEVWPLAKRAGFSDIEIGYWMPALGLMSLPEYESYVHGRRWLPRRLARATRLHLRERRLFFLYRYEMDGLTSRQKRGLAAQLKVEPAAARVAVGEAFTATVRVRNTGSATWLRSSAPLGAVNLGVRRPAGLFRRPQDVHRQALPEPANQSPGHPPGTELTLQVRIPPLAPGRHVLLFDLVSEHVAWFASCGGRATRVVVEVG